MENRLDAYRGCLLGLAVGDAMGYAVDHRSLEEIRQAYGPGGLQEMELVNGYAQITSYTQTAACVCNGLLLGVTQGQMRGTMAPHIRYIALALSEWARFQSSLRESSALLTCWVSREDSLFVRRCMDTQMLDALNTRKLGTMEEPVNREDGPGALSLAVPVGLFFDPERLKRREIARLGAETVALTHGDPTAFLSGAALAHIISRIARDAVTDLRKLVKETLHVLRRRFGRTYRQTWEVCALLKGALSGQTPEELGCRSAASALAGALSCCLRNPGDFDGCLRDAVNHSGASCAVGAVAGAIMGALLGADAIGEEEIQCLEPAAVLAELAGDMLQGCPMTADCRIIDLDWERKYISPGSVC